jgi:hypothetical protein
MLLCSILLYFLKFLAEDLTQSDVSKSDHGLASLKITNDSIPRATNSDDAVESVTDEIVDPSVPYSRLKILRSIDSAPSSSLSPAGIAGQLKVTLVMSGPSLAHARMTSAKGPKTAEDKPLPADTNKSLDQRYCILLDGIFTFLPPAVSQISGAQGDSKSTCDAQTKTRAVGSMENRSISLSGYVIRKVDEKKILLKGSKGESTSYLLETITPEDCRRWLNVISAHVEHVDSHAGSKWLF